MGDEFIFTLTKFDTEYYSESERSVGDKMKIKITDIMDEGYYFDVEYDEWDFIS